MEPMSFKHVPKGNLQNFGPFYQ